MHSEFRSREHLESLKEFANQSMWSVQDYRKGKELVGELIQALIESQRETELAADTDNYIRSALQANHMDVHEVRRASWYLEMIAWLIEEWRKDPSIDIAEYCQGILHPVPIGAAVVFEEVSL